MKKTIRKRKSKKALSEIVAYVLLVVIAISLSIAVYAFLRYYLPKQKNICPEDTAIIIKDYSCDVATINLTLQNKGFFNIDGVNIRISSQADRQPTIPIEKDGAIFFINPLSPGQTYSKTFTKTGSIKKIEIEPFIIKDSIDIFCDKATITQELNCD